ncbi:MAG TPA: sensor histidine kinase [Candidatus Dormibacteraeota bacterium]|nr:sensor histidine kinase [Candidatus Dormibacteraeota bacterium]
MTVLADLFETNRVIVLSVDGQVFFVLGLAIALQSLKRSALALARPLPWLAAFGIVHGFHEWGYLFVPIQSGYLPLPATEALLVLQLLIKGASYALLLQFGVELLAVTTTLPILGRLRLLPAAALLAWGGATLAVSAAVAGFEPDPLAWLPEGRIDAALAAVGAPLAVGDVLARWMLGLPGAALAAWGLVRSARTVGPMARPPVGIGLRVAAGAFAVYALVGGLVGMPAPFPPADVLNAASVRDALGIPIEVLRSATGLVIAVAIIMALDLFEQETDRALAEARRHELLGRERERIGRDLHDGIIQSIYAAGLHLEEASATLEPAAEAPRGRIRTVLAELDRISGDIRRTIFDLRSASLDTLDAEEIVRSVADELRANTLVALDLRVEGAWVPDLTVDQAEELRQIVHEAFSNVLRHAGARHVAVRLASSRRRMTLEIRDDGVGFDQAAAAERGRTGRAQGLANLRRRAELLHATIDLRSAPGQGTALSLTMPVAASRRPQ